MANSRRSINLPPSLADAAEERARELGYPSLNAYFKALIRYDLLVAGDHSVTQPVAELPAHVQDRFDDTLIKNWKDGVRERGSYLKWCIRQMVEEAEGADPKDIEGGLLKKLT
jgi:hypothetical protein